MSGFDPNNNKNSDALKNPAPATPPKAPALPKPPAPPAPMVWHDTPTPGFGPIANAQGIPFTDIPAAREPAPVEADYLRAPQKAKPRPARFRPRN